MRQVRGGAHRVRRKAGAMSALPSRARFEVFGRSLREIDPRTLAADPEDGPVRWFLGEGGCEVFVWLDAGGAAHHAQLVLGQVTLEWSPQRGLSTSSFVGGGSMLGGRHDGYLLRDGTRDEGGVVAAAHSFLQASPVGMDLFAPILASLGRALAGPDKATSPVPGA